MPGKVFFRVSLWEKVFSRTRRKFCGVLFFCIKIRYETHSCLDKETTNSVLRHSDGLRPLKVHSQLLSDLSHDYFECFEGILTMDISVSSSPRLFCLWLGSSMGFKQTQESRETGS